MAQYEHILHVHQAPFNAKAFQGAALYQSYDAIKSILETFDKHHLVPYFAIPNIDPINNDMTWSAMTDGGQPIAMAELGPQEQQDLTIKIQAVHDELAQLVKHIEDSRGSSDAGNLLVKLLDPPDWRHIYSVNERPVFVYWSHEQEDPVPRVTHPLIARIDTAPVQTPIGSAGTVNRTTATGDEGRVEELKHIYVYANWLHFVGAVSFFGIALAAILLAIAITFYSGLNKTLGTHSYETNDAETRLALSCAPAVSMTNKGSSKKLRQCYNADSILQEI